MELDLLSLNPYLTGCGNFPQLRFWAHFCLVSCGKFPQLTIFYVPERVPPIFNGQPDFCHNNTTRGHFYIIIRRWIFCQYKYVYQNISNLFSPCMHQEAETHPILYDNDFDHSWKFEELQQSILESFKNYDNAFSACNH